jgi:hypothetical protein
MSARFRTGSHALLGYAQPVIPICGPGIVDWVTMCSRLYGPRSHQDTMPSRRVRVAAE